MFFRDILRVSGCLAFFMHVKSMIAGMVTILPLGSDRKKIQVFQQKKKKFLNQIFFLSKC